MILPFALMQEVHDQETAQILKLYLLDKEYEDPGFAGRNFFAARFSCGFFSMSAVCRQV